MTERMMSPDLCRQIGVLLYSKGEVTHVAEAEKHLKEYFKVDDLGKVSEAAARAYADEVVKQPKRKRPHRKLKFSWRVWVGVAVCLVLLVGVYSLLPRAREAPHPKQVEQPASEAQPTTPPAVVVDEKKDDAVAKAEALKPENKPAVMAPATPPVEQPVAVQDPAPAAVYLAPVQPGPEVSDPADAGRAARINALKGIK